MTSWPKVTIVIPTLNSENVLISCLESIARQDYPKEAVEILVCDGGSKDGTLDLAKKFQALVVENKLKTGEAGKAVGVKAATGDFVALIDSDNILPTNNWLKEMIKPLLDNPDALGSEPLYYTYRLEDGFITRYCALLGMNDPFVLFLGNYDRYSILTGKWTEVLHDEIDKGDYLLCTFDGRGIPTVGANGTVFRAEVLKNSSSDYLFDIDMLATLVATRGSVKFIKVKNGIIHTFCESSILKFARKQRRRVKDFLYHQKAGHRSFNWGDYDLSGKSSMGMLKFIASCVFVLPLIVQTVAGYLKKPDVAWLFHVVACEITLIEYAAGRLGSLYSSSELDRTKWSQ